ncbi:MAG TPA: HAD family hydrolase [Candidatus Limnocylindrales bacterium]|jgi:putative hydrolase of the HAD superfamily|nr:HAD family hydrolase [Candidatus Limnocylindrales bacterium]
MAFTLLFDGDDTLWANNHHFERAIERFCALVVGGEWTEQAVRDELDRVEEAAWHRGGAGKDAFGRNMREAAAGMVLPGRLPAVLAAVDAIVREMETSAVALMPGVVPTLEDLGRRHVLGIVTRGDPAEQWAKIDGSGISNRFTHIEVVRDKDEATYRRLVAAWGLDPATTWMIGNSPRSDILPARAAGLRAVYIPNPSTWRLEHAELDPADGGVMTLAAFGELLGAF